MKQYAIGLFMCFLFTIIGVQQKFYAQESPIVSDSVNQANLGQVNDEFQELFFDALAQKAILNHEQAINLLLKAKKFNRSLAVDLELGKNYFALKDYKEAENSLQLLLQKYPQKREAKSLLFQVYLKTNQYKKAIPLAQDFAKKNNLFYEDLANLYFLTQNYEAALESLDYLNLQEGYSEYRENFKKKIFQKAPASLKEIYLRNYIDRHTGEEDAYLVLMQFYQEQNEHDKMMQVAQKLLRVNANAPAAHYALYKQYLKDKKFDQAISSIKEVIKNVDNLTIKKRVLQDFAQFVQQQPQYKDEFLALVETEIEREANSELVAKYMVDENQLAAFKHYTSKLQEDPYHFETLKNVLILAQKLNKYEVLLEVSQQAIDVYPSQAFFYYTLGWGQLNTLKLEATEKNLLISLDLVVNNPNLQADIYRALINYYQEMNNSEKVQSYKNQLQNLKNR